LYPPPAGGDTAGTMFVLFTDFGPAGPYVGQMKAVLAQRAPSVPIVDLLSDAPACDAQKSAYLLAALAPDFPVGSVFLAVVDPGVGGDRSPVVAEADGRRFVGPDNGLFDPLLRRAAEVRAWRITWSPDHLSATFHGRDLFAPVAAMLANGEPVPGNETDVAALRRPDWPDDLAEVIYIDHFGNAMTGQRASVVSPDTIVEAAGHRFTRARTFSDVARGQPFWYENANGLVELAVNGGRADLLGLGTGSPVGLTRPVGQR
jgi:hypothetical protein